MVGIARRQHFVQRVRKGRQNLSDFKVVASVLEFLAFSFDHDPNSRHDLLSVCMYASIFACFS
jgi:hypothetical protein